MYLILHNTNRAVTPNLFGAVQTNFEVFAHVTQFV